MSLDCLEPPLEGLKHNILSMGWSQTVFFTKGHVIYLILWCEIRVGGDAWEAAGRLPPEAFCFTFSQKQVLWSHPKGVYRNLSSSAKSQCRSGENLFVSA